MDTGYSKTALAKKLGIKPGHTRLLYDPPDHYEQLFSDLPDDLLEGTFENESVDFIHLFITTQENLENQFLKYKTTLKKNGLMWISWPKGKSKIVTNLKRDYIREYGLDHGLVDVKVAAIDEDWSGVKFVYRLKDR